MAKETPPEGQDECDGCRFPTRELSKVTPPPFGATKLVGDRWFCRVCMHTMVSSVELYPSQWSHENGEIMRTIAFGINATMAGGIPK